MADWKRLAKSLVLAHGFIDDREADIIRAELLTDGVMTKGEAEFLIDLRNSAARAVPRFHLFVFEVVKKALLADGDITAAEAAWLQKFVLADGRVDALEKTLLRELKAGAKRTSPEFEALVKKYA
jgi:hypothetical protein